MNKSEKNEISNGDTKERLNFYLGQKYLWGLETLKHVSILNISLIAMLAIYYRYVGGSWLKVNIAILLISQTLVLVAFCATTILMEKTVYMLKKFLEPAVYSKNKDGKKIPKIPALQYLYSPESRQLTLTTNAVALLTIAIAVLTSIAVISTIFHFLFISPELSPGHT